MQLELQEIRLPSDHLQVQRPRHLSFYLLSQVSLYYLVYIVLVYQPLGYAPLVFISITQVAIVLHVGIIGTLIGATIISFVISPRPRAKPLQIFYVVVHFIHIFSSTKLFSACIDFVCRQLLAVQLIYIVIFPCPRARLFVSSISVVLRG